MGLKFSDVLNSLAAISKVPGNGLAQIVAFTGYYELGAYKYTGEPGAYGPGFPGVKSEEDSKLITDLPPSIALGMEPGDTTILKERPRPKNEPVALGWASKQS